MSIEGTFDLANTIYEHPEVKKALKRKNIAVDTIKGLVIEAAPGAIPMIKVTHTSHGFERTSLILADIFPSA